MVLGEQGELKADEEQSSGEEDDDKTSEEVKLKQDVIATDLQQNVNEWNMVEHIFFIARGVQRALLCANALLLTRNIPRTRLSAKWLQRPEDKIVDESRGPVQGC